MSVLIRPVTGAALQGLIPALAKLRITVFRDWPYLYDGGEDYERKYLQVYVDSDRAMIAVATDGEDVVGASTCLPMVDAGSEMREPLMAAGFDPARIFYFGESLLLPAYRGQGVGVEFFKQREAHAMADGVCDHALFYAVRRPADHPARPADATSLHEFWRHRGYAPLAGVSCRMAWKQVAQGEVSNTLDAWMKRLRP
jgi:GNAT superfamily N-acetyltransferase